MFQKTFSSYLLPNVISMSVSATVLCGHWQHSGDAVTRNVLSNSDFSQCHLLSAVLKAGQFDQVYCVVPAFHRLT